MVVYETKVYYVDDVNIRFKITMKWHRCLLGTLKWWFENLMARRSWGVWWSQIRIFYVKGCIVVDNQWSYGNFSSCATKGYFVCPICKEKIYSHILKHGMKCIYIVHKKYLPRNHPFRNQKKAFNGKQEHGLHPEPLSGE